MFVKSQRVIWSKKTIALLITLTSIFYLSLFFLVIVTPKLLSPIAIVTAVLLVFFTFLLLVFGTVKMQLSTVIVEKEWVEKIFEAEIKLGDFLKAVLLTRFYVSILVVLSSISILLYIFSLGWVIPSLFGGVVGALWGSSIKSAGKLLVTDKGIVRHGYLTKWENFKRCSARKGFIILYAKLGYPEVVLPYIREVYSFILSKITKNV